MKELLREKTIFYNSNARQSGTEIYNHSTIVPTDLFELADNEVGELELIQFSSKMSYYNITYNRNARFSYSEDSGATYSTVVFSDGNYSIIEVKDALQILLNGVATDLTWTVGLNLNSMKMTYSYTGIPSGTVIFAPIADTDTFEILGFPEVPKTMTSLETSTHICTIGNIEALFIHCNFANSTLLSSLVAESQNSVLAEIPILCPFFGVIYWEKNSDYAPSMELPEITSLSHLDFSLTDKHNHYIEFSEDYTMTFKFNVYRKDKVNLSKMETLMNLTMMNKLSKQSTA